MKLQDLEQIVNESLNTLDSLLYANDSENYDNAYNSTFYLKNNLDIKLKLEYSFINDKNSSKKYIKKYIDLEISPNEYYNVKVLYKNEYIYNIYSNLLLFNEGIKPFFIDYSTPHDMLKENKEFTFIINKNQTIFINNIFYMYNDHIDIELETLKNNYDNIIIN